MPPQNRDYIKITTLWKFATWMGELSTLTNISFLNSAHHLPVCKRKLKLRLIPYPPPQSHHTSNMACLKGLTQFLVGKLSKLHPRLMFMFLDNHVLTILSTTLILSNVFTEKFLKHLYNLPTLYWKLILLFSI